MKKHEVLPTVAISLISALATLVALEIMLRLADFRELRGATSERSLAYRYDAELGWAPIPHSSATLTTARTIHAQHNSLGLRDDEFSLDSRPTILFLGDSFVWGVDAEANERFTDLLRKRVSNYKIVNAGVSGYGTDQEYLFLKRLWAKVQPAVVVLIFCTLNDRIDNRLNIRYDGYQKPYFVTASDGSLVLAGQPVPKSRQVYITENWLVRHLWLARLATAAYVEIRYPKRYVADTTERLVSKIHEFVESKGAKLLVGLQLSDPELIRHLQTNRISFVTFDEAESYSTSSGSHWTPDGQKLVTERVLRLLSENNLVQTDNAPQ